MAATRNVGWLASTGAEKCKRDRHRTAATADICHGASLGVASGKWRLPASRYKVQDFVEILGLPKNSFTDPIERWLPLEPDPGTCVAPQSLQEMLRAEGFTDIRYVDLTEAHMRRANAANSGLSAI
jgi:hypothetical protein